MRWLLKCRECEIAPQDAGHTLSNTVNYCKGEVARLEKPLAGCQTSARTSDEKFAKQNPLLPGIIIQIEYLETAKKRGSSHKFSKSSGKTSSGLKRAIGSPVNL